MVGVVVWALKCPGGGGGGLWLVRDRKYRGGEGLGLVWALKYGGPMVDVGPKISGGGAMVAVGTEIWRAYA